MVRLVGDDEVEVPRAEPVEPPHERGHRRRHHLLARACALGHLDAHGHVVVGLRLLEDLASVRQDEHAPAPREPRERDRLAQAGGHLHKVRAGLERVAHVNALLLVVAQLERGAVLRGRLLSGPGRACGRRARPLRAV